MLTSARNPRVVAVAKLHDPRHRRATGLTILEGPHQLADAVAAGAQVREAYVLEDDESGAFLASAAGVAVTRVDESVLRRIAGSDNPRGPVAVVAIPRSPRIAAVDSIVLWGVQDPGNVGAIIRSAAAFGFAVIAGSGTSDVWAPKAIRAAAATQFAVPLSVTDVSVEGLRRTGLRPVAAVARDGMDPAEVPTSEPIALLVGNEAAGLPDDVVAEIEDRVTLRLDGGVESLNVAVAGAVLMYALRGGRERPDGRSVDRGGDVG